MRWRGIPLMKNVFDFAMYPALIAELRPRTVFEVGSGLGASAIWFADTMTFCGIEGRVHSVDRVKATIEHPRVEFRQGDCSDPEHLFDPGLLGAEPHPWLVVEDAHHNVGAVLEHFHKYLSPGDYLVVEDSDVKRDTLRQFRRRSSRRVFGGYALYRQFRPQCHLRQQFDLCQDTRGRLAGLARRRCEIIDQAQLREPRRHRHRRRQAYSASVRISSPIWFWFTPSMFCNISCNVVCVCVFSVPALLTVVCALARSASISLIV